MAQGYPQGNAFGAEDQERLLDEATAVVKEQAFYMKKAIDSDNVREALKNASNMICELRTSLLSPKNYFELYMQVFNEMQHLSGFFGDKTRHKKKMIDLYESVQHAGNILPRLYLLATVAAAYIKSLEAPAKEILKDVNELCKGVQHPLRGLFLRYYLSQMLKDKLPDTGSGFEGEGGDINDAFDFIFTNFNESNRLWVRIQNQGPAREKDPRERERHDLRVLVGANLVRLSQLDGMTMDFYAETALPKILDHIVSVKDTLSQQYLLESMIQVFPDEFHIRTLEQVLSAYARALPSVDMKPIMVKLMNRLATYLSEADPASWRHFLPVSHSAAGDLGTGTSAAGPRGRCTHSRHCTSFGGVGRIHAIYGLSLPRPGTLCGHHSGIRSRAAPEIQIHRLGEFVRQGCGSSR